MLLDESAASILFELDRIKNSLMQIAQRPTSGNVDKNDVDSLIEKHMEKIAEIEIAVKSSFASAAVADAHS